MSSPPDEDPRSLPVREGNTALLYRPVGAAEMKLIEDSAHRRFPPRLPEQPIFYPVCNERYAREIAERWNVRESGGGRVTRFRVRLDYLDKQTVHVVGAPHHAEYWIPAAELDAFNNAIVGLIDVVAEYPATP